jgi:hypothetical protein
MHIPDGWKYDDGFKVDWPKNPKEGEKFFYWDCLSGNGYNSFVFLGGKWQFLSTD